MSTYFTLFRITTRKISREEKHNIKQAIKTQ